MVGQSRLGTFLAHAILLVGVALTIFPLWLAIAASTQSPDVFLSGRLSVFPGSHGLENYQRVLFEGAGLATAKTQPFAHVLLNSFVMATTIAVGKIVISLLSAFAVVYFRFPFRTAAFFIIFMTLMLPVEVRILPTYEIIARLDLLNSWVGLTVPLIASATATFLFRQFFLTIPEELTDAALIDGAGPMSFFRYILVPMSITNIAALFVILFIYGWNQYLWPLLVTTDANYTTVLITIKRLMTTTDEQPLYHLVMAVAVLAALPPMLVIIFMQRLFVKGLVETEK
jgi:sn-glycerol 3-phosphate transport system permease protein